MGSVVISGSTSGTVTVSAPAEAGTRTLTLPAATGTAVLEDGSNNLQMNSGYGSSATAYGVRAWVNFNGTGTVAIRGSGNVSSITDNGTGDYTVTIDEDLPDINYTYTISTMDVGSATSDAINSNASAAEVAQTATAFRFVIRVVGGSVRDTDYNNVIVVR
jgi:hypothetical protein